MSFVLFVRIQSDLTLEEVEGRVQERIPAFLEVPGLLQKIFGHDPITGDICGIYFFESQEALDNYRSSALGKSIPSAYEATHVRKEMYELLSALRPEQGPI